MRRVVPAFMLAFLTAAMVIPPNKAAHADLLLDISGDALATCGACGDNGVTMGWAFTVVNSVTIDELGVFDVGADGLDVASVPVGLWTSGGSLLAQAAVTSASTAVASTDAAGDWLFEPIASITLAPGDYLLGATFGPDLPLGEAGDGITFSTSPDITGIDGRIGDVDAGFEAPTTEFPIPIFGPSMREVALPEPGSLALLGVAFAGLARVRRRSSRNCSGAQ